MTTAIAKILNDGTQVPVTDPSTDHIAVLFDDGTMIYPCSIGQGPDPDADDFDIDAADEPFESWDAALAAIEHANKVGYLLGFSDWHLATVEEYKRYVINRRFYAPAVDKNLFPGVRDEWHWSSTPDALSSKSAWYIDFDDGSVYLNRRGRRGFALAVRRAASNAESATCRSSPYPKEMQ